MLEAARHRLGKEKRTQCGPPTKSKIVVLERNRAQAAAAADHFRTAIRLWKGGDAANPIAGGDAEGRRSAAAYAAAGAAFYLAESNYEDLLRVKFPQELDFSHPSPSDGPRHRAATARKLEDSKRRFAAYLEEKARRLEGARGDYLEVFKLRQAQWTIAAAARIGQLHQDFAGQLYTADPQGPAGGRRLGQSPARSLLRRAGGSGGQGRGEGDGGLQSCLGAATEQSWYNEWSRLCERELNQIAPAEFPLSSELAPEASYVPVTMSAAPLGVGWRAWASTAAAVPGRPSARGSAARRSHRRPRRTGRREIRSARQRRAGSPPSG